MLNRSIVIDPLVERINVYLNLVAFLKLARLIKKDSEMMPVVIKFDIIVADLHPILDHINDDLHGGKAAIILVQYLEEC